MKNFLLAALMICSTAAYAQVRWGVKGGISLNNIRAVDLPESFDRFDSKIGFHLGGFLSTQISDKVMITPELLFAQRGARDGDVTVNLSYIEIPIMVAYLPVDKVAIEAGPSVGFKIAGRGQVDGRSFNLDDTYEETLDFGANFGARFKITESFSIYGRYYFGLATIDETVYLTIDGSRYEVKEYNRSLQVGVMYFIR